MLSQNVIDEVLKRSDIVDVISSYIHVIKKGRSYTAICPFHDDKNPSMMISKEKQIFKCFVCQTGGNAITFIQKYENISFENAVLKLAELIGYTSDELKESKGTYTNDKTHEHLYSTIKDLSDFYQMSLMAKEGQKGKEYLNNREINEDIIKQFSIGFCPDNPYISVQYLSAKNHTLKDIESIGVLGHSLGQYVDKNAGRVVFPLKDVNGRPIGFSARRIVDNDEAKYVNSPETVLFQKGNNLYNYSEAKKTARLDGYCYLLEGFMDVIALYKAGIKSSVALMGTALTSQQVALLKRLNVEIRICLDSDLAGQLAIMKAISLFDKFGVKYRIVRKSNGPKDADEILSKYGSENLLKWLNSLIDKVQFAMTYYAHGKDLNSIDDKKKFIMDFLPFLKDVNNELELEDYIVNISKLTNFDKSIIKNAVKKVKSQKVDDLSSAIINPHPERRALKRLTLTEKALIYQMLNSKDATNYYKDHSYRRLTDIVLAKIADYIIDYYQSHSDLVLNDFINVVSQTDDQHKEQIISEVINISTEKINPKFSKELLDEYFSIIEYESQKEYEKYLLNKTNNAQTDREKLEALLRYNKKLNDRLNGNKED